MTDSPLGSSCDIIEHVVGVRKRCVSLSSVDSEPICKRCRPDAPPDGTRGDDNNDHGSDSAESDVHITRHEHSSAEPETNIVVAEALLDSNGEPLVKIPIQRVSEAFVATTTAVIARSCTVVADNAAGALVMDVGTRLCLADGSIVGVVTTVMGPVSSCVYAVVCHPTVFTGLCEDGGRLAVGVELCCDLGEQRVIYDPVAQCDTRRGTDASYINDEELPANARPDFSDDEMERRWKLERRVSRHACNDAGQESLSSDSDVGDHPVEVDWDKLDALEGYLHDCNNGNVVSDANAVEENRSTPSKQCKNRLVIPPWIVKGH